MAKKFQYFRDWVEKERLFAQARRRLEKGNADQLAAESMFRLNRAAKGGWSESSTYEMKNHLVRILYQKGYCTRVLMAVQTLECWHTRGYMEGWTDHCPKCNGTGVYARHELYHFTFLVGGVRYTWHQPSRLVDWPVTLTGEMMAYDAHEPEEIDVDGWKLAEDQALVYVYLQQAGVQMRAVKPLREAVWNDYLEIKRDVWNWYWMRTRKIRRWLRGKNEPWAETLRKVLGDPIRFRE